jgi:hypothetical protein
LTRCERSGQNSRITGVILITPLVNCGPQSYFHHIAITCLLYSHYLLYSHTSTVSTRYAHTLCFKQTGEIDNLIASWEQSTWLCYVQVPRCS